MTQDRLIVVTGATGRQGGAVARHLLADGWRVRAVTRNPGSAAAARLAARGAEVVRAALDDASSLASAVAGAHGVYSVQNFWDCGVEREIRQGKAVAAAAAAAGVRHFVYGSVGSAAKGSGVEHFESKFVVEDHIRGLGLPATFVRPACFMENYYIPEVEIALLKGRLLDPVRAGKPFQLIAVDDIGAFVALAFRHVFDRHLQPVVRLHPHPPADHRIGPEVVRADRAHERIPVPAPAVILGEIEDPAGRGGDLDARLDGGHLRAPPGSTGNGAPGCARRRRYQPSLLFSSVTSRSAIIMFSATFGWYWQAYLSDVCAGMLEKNSTLLSPAALRAATASRMWPLMVERSPPFSSGAMMQTMYVCGYSLRMVCSSVM